MKRPNKLLFIIAAILMAFLLTIIPASADTGESTLQISGEPAKLIIQLGPGWSGTQFELRTDAGVYPGTIVVSDTGLLQMDLSGSKTFTLSRVQATAQQPNTPAATGAYATPTADAATAAANAPPATEATTATDMDMDAFLAALTEPNTEITVEQPAPQKEEVTQEVSIKHALLFGVGIVAAVAALIILSRLKKRRVDDDEEEDYEE